MTSYSDIIFIAIALAMDCLAVSVANGTLLKKTISKNSLIMASSFGFFQGAMPILGYAIGSSFSDTISVFDHWIALLLLSFLGLKMIIDSQKEEKDTPDKAFCNSKVKILTLSVATSIDALTTGVLFVSSPAKLFFALFTIGMASFILSIIGNYLGAKIGENLKVNFGGIGGLVLILIGIKIFITDLMA